MIYSLALRVRVISVLSLAEMAVWTDLVWGELWFLAHVGIWMYSFSIKSILLTFHAICYLLNFMSLLKPSPSSVLSEDVIFIGTHYALWPHTEPHTYAHNLGIQSKLATWSQWWKNTFIEVHGECRKKGDGGCWLCLQYHWHILKHTHTIPNTHMLVHIRHLQQS